MNGAAYEGALFLWATRGDLTYLILDTLDRQAGSGIAAPWSAPLRSPGSAAYLVVCKVFAAFVKRSLGPTLGFTQLGSQTSMSQLASRSWDQNMEPELTSLKCLMEVGHLAILGVKGAFSLFTLATFIRTLVVFVKAQIFWRELNSTDCPGFNCQESECCIVMDSFGLVKCTPPALPAGFKRWLQGMAMRFAVRNTVRHV
ncbi:hypothetical protein MKZ38_004542 [Zalerion maritima]|uniref:Uncharacterized protein n=1 Tax=Zalerion maritima TaxID=339359 RepID=A0AAD5WQZ6_9PEZI|nr:hypothetical protein MKZ38_004542 [Zalerion maritima]